MTDTSQDGPFPFQPLPDEPMLTGERDEPTEPVVDEEEADRHLVGILTDVVKQLSITREGYEGVDAILNYPEGVPWEYHTAAVMAGFILCNAAGVTPEQVADIVAAMREQERTGEWCPVCESADHALSDCPKAPNQAQEDHVDEQG